MNTAKLDALCREHRDLIADMARINARQAAARPPAPLAKSDAPMDIKALVTESGQLIAYVGPISEPMAKAHPKPAARRPAPSRREWQSLLKGHETLAQSIETSLMKTRIRRQIEAGRDQVARGELSAHEAAVLNVVMGRAAAMGVWQ